MRAGGGAVEGRFCKSAGGRLNAKLPRNRIFVFLVVEYFEAWGVVWKKNEWIYCSGGTSLDAEQNNGQKEEPFRKIPRTGGGCLAVGSAQSEGHGKKAT
jgi:hypothetical protein